MELTILLDSESKFHKAKLALLALWNGRAETALHEVEIREHNTKRSNDANRYYWVAVVTPLATYLGYTPEECHEVLLCQIYGTKTIRFKTPSGVAYEYQTPNKRTHNMNKKEFADHIEHSSRIAAECGVYIERSVP